MSAHPITKNLLKGVIAREPVGDEQGYWAGAPGWYWDEPDQVAYICYRIRRPRGIEPDRGGEARIAKTTDFENFTGILLLLLKIYINVYSDITISLTHTSMFYITIEDY